ncbi:MAG: hypothetical protein PW734_09740 [Verrucomicrobium sp.]|nr:hypothetical protein [Verrucomicrobium sp.]
MKPFGKAAFSLMEVVLALGLISFCLIALMGLLVAGLKNNRQTRSMVDATAAASLLVESLRASTNNRPVNLPQIPLPTGMEVASNTAPLYVDSGGYLVGSPRDAAFALNYRVQVVDTNLDICRIYIGLSAPPQAPVNSKERSTYEVLSSFQMR